MTPTVPVKPNSSFPYPPAPVLPNADFLEPSPAFRQHVRRTLLGIIAFVGLYVCLIAFGLVLGYICVFSTLWIISHATSTTAWFIAAGLLALGVMFLLFLIKFLFAVYRNEDGQRLEITAKDHPKLFAFINQLTDEVNAPKPYRIYISPNVNASVFYNSSFWSLFFPVQKNLEIGLGLVNSLNMSEFKAVMAHEFGHFSQRSMKLGSYVYIVNRVIYNLVYERDRWDNLLDRWAASGGLWSLFAGLTHVLVNLVRKILSKAYQWLNLRYLSLSREMEYQADLVAVSAAGGQSIITALRRIELGDAAYQQMLGYLNELVGESKVVKNMYSVHTETIHMLASENNIDLSNELPVLNDEQAMRMAAPNRVNFQDQWSSHPSQPERETNIRSVVAVSKPDESSPWQLFNEPESWQKKLTNRLYDGVKLADASARKFIEPTDYKAYVVEQTRRNQLPERYNGFYDRRLLHIFDPVELATKADSVPKSEALFSDENRKLRKQLFTNYEDRNTLEQIKAGQIQTRSFDFDGKKYDRKEVDEVLSELNTETESLQYYFQKAEENAFRWHYQQAALQGLENELIERTELYFQLDNEREAYQQLFGAYSEVMQKTRAHAKDGWIPKREIDEVSEKIQQAYRTSQAIHVPERIANYTFKNGYVAFLFDDQPQVRLSDSVDSLEWEQMVKLYQQLEIASQRTAQVQIAVLTDLIHWQGTL